MTERWLGITVSGDKVDMFDALVPPSGHLMLQMEATWKLANGSRPRAYAVMFARVSQYVVENGIKHVVIMASATSAHMKLAHLAAAELRGVVAAGAGSAAGIEAVEFTPKSTISNNYGDRNTSEYVHDETFWKAEVDKKIPIERREAAMLVLAKTRPRSADAT